MKRLGLAPQLLDIKNDAPPVNDWLRRMTDFANVPFGPNNPTVGEVPENQWFIYRNTTIPEVRIWTNIAGVLLKSAAFT